MAKEWPKELARIPAQTVQDVENLNGALENDTLYARAVSFKSKLASGSYYIIHSQTIGIILC